MEAKKVKCVVEANGMKGFIVILNGTTTVNSLKNIVEKALEVSIKHFCYNNFVLDGNLKLVEVADESTINFIAFTKKQKINSKSFKSDTEIINYTCISESKLSFFYLCQICRTGIISQTKETNVFEKTKGHKKNCKNTNILFKKINNNILNLSETKNSTDTNSEIEKNHEEYRLEIPKLNITKKSKDIDFFKQKVNEMIFEQNQSNEDKEFDFIQKNESNRESKNEINNSLIHKNEEYCKKCSQYLEFIIKMISINRELVKRYENYRIIEKKILKYWEEMEKIELNYIDVFENFIQIENIFMKIKKNSLKISKLIEFFYSFNHKILSEKEIWYVYSICDVYSIHYFDEELLISRNENNNEKNIKNFKDSFEKNKGKINLKIKPIKNNWSLSNFLNENDLNNIIKQINTDFTNFFIYEQSELNKNSYKFDFNYLQKEKKKMKNFNFFSNKIKNNDFDSKKYANLLENVKNRNNIPILSFTEKQQSNEELIEILKKALKETIEKNEDVRI
jgi:hypothetical protein